MLDLMPILAQGEQAANLPMWAPYVPFVVLGLLVIMMIRSSSKGQKELKNALAALKKNDKVLTSGGILGVVVAIKDNEDEVTLKVDDTSNTRIRVLKSSIVRINAGEQAVGDSKTP